jgi:4-amino-4-deoxy-L-arabinose transferase-like glycosyltransferase
MLKNWYVGVFVAVVLLAAVLRLYRLGDVPHGMTWDEAAIGYNGHAIRVARRDEWLVRLPVSFKSFGDYKSPLAIYINGVSTGLFGMNLWAVRLPFAIAGIGAVASLIWLTRLLLQDSIPHSFSLLVKTGMPWLSLAAGFLLATTPWHVHFSRVGFESGMALFFLLTGVWLVFESLSTQAPPWKKYGVAMGAGVNLVAAMYTYHSAKVVVPALIVLILIMWADKVKAHWRAVGTALLTFGLLAWPLIKDSLWGFGGERFHQATLFNKGLTALVLVQTFTHQLLEHLSLSFLVYGVTPTLRHGDGSWGVLLITCLGLVLVGFVSLGHQAMMGLTRRASFSSIRLPLLAAAWILIGTAPAAVGVDVPHSNRALLALPGFILLAVWGMAWLIEAIRGSRFNATESGTHGEKHTILKSVIGMWVLIHCLLVISYQRHYYTVFAAQSAAEFKDGYLDAFKYVIPFEKGLNGVQPVDQVVFSSEYGQPYIYALFSRKTDPIYYQGGSLNKYLFVDEVKVSDLDRPNTLVVGSAKDALPPEKADKLIYGSDGQIKFKIYRTP